MKSLFFAAALAAVSLFGFVPCAVAQDDKSTMERLDDGSLESVTLVGVTIPETGDAVIEYRRRGGEIRACPENDMKVAKFMATFKTGARASILPDALDDCPVVQDKK